MKREPRSGICPRCGEGWSYATRSEPAEACGCTEREEQPDPLADEGQSDARELARDRP